MTHTLTITRNARSAFFFGMPDGATDLLTEPDWYSDIRHQLITGAVRCALREERCTKVPVVLGLARLIEPDESGNLYLAELEYDGEACVLMGGGYLDEYGRRIAWTVYAD